MGSETPAKSIPVIDFNNQNLSPGSSSWVSTSHLVRETLESYGCFIAVYKKCPQELHGKMFNLAKELLFELPVEIKEKNFSECCGFGYGANFPKMPLIEYFGITNAGTVEGTKDFTNLLWPAGNDDFFETTLVYSKIQSELNDVVVKMVVESYGIGDYYDILAESSLNLMRFIKYRTPKKDEINVGLHPHVDKSFLAVIATNHVQGLQIENRYGEWMNFEPSPFSFVVVSGEFFTAWSNGRIYCPLHRVVMGGTEEKYTVGMFKFMHKTLQIPEELVDEDNPLKYKPVINNFELLEYCSENNIARGAIDGFFGI